jgi:hypothetical protein
VSPALWCGAALSAGMGGTEGSQQICFWLAAGSVNPLLTKLQAWTAGWVPARGWVGFPCKTPSHPYSASLQWLPVCVTAL